MKRRYKIINDLRKIIKEENINLEKYNLGVIIGRRKGNKVLITISKVKDTALFLTMTSDFLKVFRLKPFEYEGMNVTPPDTKIVMYDPGIFAKNELIVLEEGEIQDEMVELPEYFLYFIKLL